MNTNVHKIVYYVDIIIVFNVALDEAENIKPYVHFVGLYVLL